MSRIGIAVSLGMICIAVTTSAFAGDIQSMLNAPAWDIAYEVTFTSNDSGPVPREAGSVYYRRHFEISYNSKMTLDMRNAGANLSMVRLTATANPSDPGLQQAVMEIVMRTESIANWISGGPQFDENASEDVALAASTAYLQSSKGTGRIDYRTVTRGTGLYDELGGKYDMTATLTRTGSGVVFGPTQLIFEIDADAKTYLLTLAHSCSDQSDSVVTEENLIVTERQGVAPMETRETRKTGVCNFFQGLRIDEPGRRLGEVPFFEGKIDPTLGKVTGEQTVKGHYKELAAEIPGTFVFKYTLTPHTAH